MENQFCATICRFHTKAENKLLIIGWFSQNGINENQLLVCLDKKKDSVHYGAGRSDKKPSQDKGRDFDHKTILFVD